MQAIYTNPYGGKFPVTILSLIGSTEHYPGGGQPFDVTSYEVEFEFETPPDPHSMTRSLKRMGFAIDKDVLGFMGGCADSGYRSFLNVTVPLNTFLRD